MLKNLTTRHVKRTGSLMSVIVPIARVYTEKCVTCAHGYGKLKHARTHVIESTEPVDMSTYNYEELNTLSKEIIRKIGSDWSHGQG